MGCPILTRYELIVNSQEKNSATEAIFHLGEKFSAASIRVKFSGVGSKNMVFFFFEIQIYFLKRFLKGCSEYLYIFNVKSNKEITNYFYTKNSN